MKQQLLEYIVRECAKQVLEALAPAEPETVGAAAPPAGGQGTADAPATQPQQSQPLFTADTKGVWFVNPKRPEKPTQLKLSAGDPGKLERELYAAAAKASGAKVKIPGSTQRTVAQALANPNSALFLYVGKINPDDEDTNLNLLAAKTYQEAKANSTGGSADYDSYNQTPKEPELKTPYDASTAAPSDASKTMAPEIDETSSLRAMVREMIREALSENK